MCLDSGFLQRIGQRVALYFHVFLFGAEFFLMRMHYFMARKRPKKSLSLTRIQTVSLADLSVLLRSRILFHGSFLTLLAFQNELEFEQEAGSQSAPTPLSSDSRKGTLGAVCCYRKGPLRVVRTVPVPRTGVCAGLALEEGPGWREEKGDYGYETV